MSNPAATKRYTALTPIEHDQVRVDEGGKLDLTDEQAAPLLALKAIEPARQRAAKATAGDGVADAQGAAAGQAGQADLVDAAGSPTGAAAGA